MNIGEYIKNIRLSHGATGFWTRYAVAKRSGLNNASLYQIEVGRTINPKPATLRKLSTALQVSYEELAEVAGIIQKTKETHQSKTLKIPLLGECPAGPINFIADDVEDWVEMSWELIKDKSCFALRVKGDCLKDKGIFNKDIVIVSKTSAINNGDIVIVRVDRDECTMKMFYKTDHQIILQPANGDQEPIVLNPKKNDVEIIGKVIRALKMF